MRRLTASLALLILSTNVSGCLGSGEDVAGFTFPEMQATAATYTYKFKTDEVSFEGTLTVTIGMPVSMRDVAGNPVKLIPVRYELISSDGLRTQAWEFLDARGVRIVAATSCEAMGGGMSSSGCGNERRASGSYAEHGLPGLLGIGPLLGSSITGRTATLPYAFFGQAYQVAYSVLYSGECATLQTTDVLTEAPGDQRFFLVLAGVARRALVCADSPFPRTVESRFLTLQKVSETAGKPLEKNDVTDEVPELFSYPPHPQARPLQGGLPIEGNATSVMSLRAALDAWRSADPSVEDFLRTRPNAHVRSSAAEPAPPWYVGAVRIEQDDLTLAISAGTEAMQATITRKCTTALGCSFEVTPTETFLVTAEASTSWLTLPRGDLTERATALVGAPASDVFFGTAWRNYNSRDLEIPGAYVFRIWAMEPDVAIGVPMSVVLDGRTGLLLQFDAPREAALRVLGLPQDWK